MQGGEEGGNKTILRVVMMLAVVVISIYTGGAAAGAMGFVQGSVATGTQFAITSGLVSMAVMTAGSMLINAIAPIRPLDTGTSPNPNPKQPYSITGSQNKVNLFGTIPVVLGRHKMFPVYGAAPYTEIVGNEEYLRMLFVWGYGPLKIEDIKIGDTLLSLYSDYEIETREGRVDDAPITLMPESVQQDHINLELVDPTDPSVSKVKNGYNWTYEDAYLTIGSWDVFNGYLVRSDGGLAGKCGALTSTSGTYQQISQRMTNVKKGEVYTVTAWVKEGTAATKTGTIFVWSPKGTTDSTNPKILHEETFTANSEWQKITFSYTQTYGDETLVLRKTSSHASAPGTLLFDSVGVYKADYSSLGWGEVIKVVQNADEISVDVLLPVGLYQFDSEGTRQQAECEIHVEWRVQGTEPWIELTSKYWKENRAKPLRWGYRWGATEGVSRDGIYEVRIIKDLYYQPVYMDKISNTVMWTSIRAIKNEHPIDFNLPLAMTALRIRATKQLNGVISELSGIVSSYVTVWDGDSWTGEAVSSNPAALYRSVLMHPANVRARSIAQINDTELGEWYNFCGTETYAFNMIRESATSVWNTCADIAAAGRGSPSLAEGLWGVVYDRADTAVVQHITPRNSWGFSSSKVLFNPPHGFRIEYKNEDNDWKDDERIVLDDGYYYNMMDAFGVEVNTVTTTLVEATQFESIPLIGITDPDLIWKFGRYHIAQARLRPEIYTLSMDFEHLVCRRGSKVLVSHDVPMWGTRWGRIKAIVTETSFQSNEYEYFEDQVGITTWEDTETAEWNKEGVESVTQVVGVKLDERFSITNSSQYVMRIRRSDDDTSQLINLAPMAVGEYDIARFETALDVGDPLIPPVGDLVIIGELTRETNECLVKSIRSSDDLSATLELVDLGEAIYEADQGTIPPFDTNITRESDVTLIIPTVPNILSVQSGTETLELGISGYLSPRIFVTCGVDTTNIRIGSYEVRYKLTDSEDWFHVTCPGDDSTAICTDVVEGGTYHIAARSISVYGIPSEWTATLNHVVVGQAELPSDVTYFTCNLLGSQAHLSWYPITDIDLSHYRIRWSPLTTGAVWEDSIDIVERVAMPATSITVPAMVGSYLIKAVDYKGNESSIATIAKASIIRIPGFTNADTISQPTWSGTGAGADYDEDIGGIYLSPSPVGENLITNGSDFTSGTPGSNDFDTDDNCVSRFRFEAGATFTHDDKGDNILTASANPPTVSTDYKEGSGSADLELDNIQYFSRTDTDLSSDFPFKSGTSNGIMSVCAWFNCESFATASDLNAIVSKYDTGFSQRSFSLRVKPSGDNHVVGVMIGYNSGANYEELTLHGTSLSLDTWYHVTFSFDASDKSYAIRLRDATGAVLGTDVEGTATNDISYTLAPFLIGVQFYNGSRYIGSRFDGKIDEVVVFKDVLTADEATAIASGDYVEYATPTGWAGEDCTLEAAGSGYEGDCLKLTSAAGDFQQANSTGIDLVVGKSYRLSAYVKSGTAGNDDYMFVVDGDTLTQGTVSDTSTTTWVSNSFDFDCTETPCYVKLRKSTSHASSPGTMFFDEVTMYELGIAEDGLYTLSDEVDLGGVYTARISASLSTSAVNLYDDLYDYADLYDIVNLYGVPTGGCGVELELRTTEDDPAGSPTWTDWSHVIVGDFTARAFQFRLYLWSGDSSITPIVEAVDIYVDLADRTQGFDQEISGAGENVIYAYPFYSIPSLSLSVNDGAAYALATITRTGFHIAFSSGTHTISGVARGHGLEEV